MTVTDAVRRTVDPRAKEAAEQGYVDTGATADTVTVVSGSGASAETGRRA